MQKRFARTSRLWVIGKKEARTNSSGSTLESRSFPSLTISLRGSRLGLDKGIVCKRMLVFNLCFTAFLESRFLRKLPFQTALQLTYVLGVPLGNLWSEK